MNLLPRTEHKSLQALIVVLSAGLLVLAARSVYPLNPFGIVLSGTIFIPMSLGLWLLKEPARKATVFLIMLCVFLLPIGMINPFALINDPTTNRDVYDLALTVYSWVAVGLLVAHLLGKHKGEFRPLKEKKPEPPKGKR